MILESKDGRVNCRLSTWSPTNKAAIATYLYYVSFEALVMNCLERINGIDL